MPMRLALVLAAAAALLLLPDASHAQRWTTVEVGSLHACALDSGGRAFCWGVNQNGQLGAETPRECSEGHHGEGEGCWAGDREAPVMVAGGRQFRAISAGGERTCALDAEGRAFCWGKGIGDSQARCGDGPCSFAPVPFAEQLRFRTLQLAEASICGVTREGAGICWRHRRQKGWGREPVFAGERLAVVGRFVEDGSPDGDVTCAVTNEGRTFCQGVNEYGQIGAGDTLPHRTPAPVASPTRFAVVVPGAMASCALTVAGEVYCWGAAAERDWSAPPPAGMFACSSSWCTLGPRPVLSGVRLRTLAHANGKFCGLDSGGGLHCWVGASEGEIPTPEPRPRFRALDGEYTRFCGLGHDGALHCWEHMYEPSAWERVPNEEPKTEPASAHY